MTSPATESTTVERIRNAEDTIETAQGVLDKAQSGLRAAEEVAVAADELKTHPAWVASVIGVLAGLIVAAAVAILMRRDGE